MDRNSPRAVRLLTALLLVGTFAAGTLTGAGIYRWAAPLPMPAPAPPHMPAPLPLGELELSQEQWSKTKIIVERHRPGLEAVVRETFPRVREINEQIEQEIREVLTPEQRTKLDAILAQRPPPPHPPPPGGHPGQPPPPPWGPPPR